jgi:hypothetical protein
MAASRPFASARWTPRGSTRLAFLIAAVVVFISCKRETTAPEYAYPEPQQYAHATFPLRVSNQWAYLDSNYYFPTPQIAQITLGSIGHYAGQTDHGTWYFYNIIGFQGGPAGEYGIRNDTVFLVDHSGNYAFLNPRIAFLPATSIHDTATIAGPWPWAVTKVYPLGHRMATPAGDFDSVYVYQQGPLQGLRLTNYTYFRPGIGVIGVDTFTDSTLIFRSLLISYVIHD